MEKHAAIGYNVCVRRFIRESGFPAGLTFIYNHGGTAMFGNRKLFRRDIEPHCAYCSRANPLDGETLSCRKRGIVPAHGSCRAFRYDPLRRIPPKPAVLRTHFTDADFQLEAFEDNHET